MLVVVSHVPCVDLEPLHLLIFCLYRREFLQIIPNVVALSRHKAHRRRQLTCRVRLFQILSLNDLIFRYLWNLHMFPYAKLDPRPPSLGCLWWVWVLFVEYQSCKTSYILLQLQSHTRSLCWTGEQLLFFVCSVHVEIIWNGHHMNQAWLHWLFQGSTKIKIQAWPLGNLHLSFTCL